MTDKVTTLLLVRHGESTWNAERRLQGHTDAPLSRRGRQQAGRLGPIVAGFGRLTATSSDLDRARETAALLGHPAARLDPRWREQDLGAWPGASIDALRRDDAAGYRAWREGRATPPGGESFQALCARIRAAVSTLTDVGGNQLVVAHGGAIRAACAVLVGLRADAVVPVGPATMTVIDITDRPRLRLYNLAPETVAPDPPD